MEVGSRNNINIERPIMEQCRTKGGGTWAAICNIWKLNKDMEKSTRYMEDSRNGINTLY